MQQKTFIKATCKNNIHAGEKVFYKYGRRCGGRIFSERVKKLKCT